MFIYCEAIESTQADRHRRELMRRAVEDVKGRRLKLIITCPIARKTLEQADAPAHASKSRRKTRLTPDPPRLLAASVLAPLLA